MKGKTIALYLISVILVSFAFFPIVMSAIGSVMPETELRSSPQETKWFARGPTFAYYQYILGAPFGVEFPTDIYLRWTLRSLVILNIAYFFKILGNSVTVAAAVALVNLTIGAIGAYGFARTRFRGSVAAYVFILLSRLLPPVVIALPYYAILLTLGLTNTHLGLVIVHSILTLPFTMWYLTLYFRTIPTDVEEAALVDGASLLQTLRSITFPIAGSGLVAIGLFSFVISYNEFMFAQFLLEKIDVQTIPIFIASLSTATDVYWALQYAILTLTVIPVIVLIAIIWKFLRVSELAGAIKR